MPERQVHLSMPPDMLVERLLYRDGLILIIDKPAGLPVHAGPKGGETLEHYFEALRFGLPARPRLGHRLDRDTSGCLALGRHKKGLRRLGQMFQAGVVQKTYYALVQGCPSQDEGVIDAPLGKRSTASHGWWMRVDPDGQQAVTEFQVAAKSGTISLLKLKPRTGRTHQLRVHLAHLGCPILGDKLYGEAAGNDGELMLHAAQLILPLYPNKPAIQADAAWPKRLLSAAAAAGLGLPPIAQSPAIPEGLGSGAYSLPPD